MTINSRKKTILSVCCAAHAVQDGLNATVYVLLPVLSQALGLNYGLVGLLKGLKSSAQGLLEIYSGVASEKFGERRLLVFSLLLAGVGFICLSLATEKYVVIACLLVVGIACGFQHAPSSSLVSRAYPPGYRRGALGLYNSSGDAGKLFYTACFSLAMTVGLMWQNVTTVFGMTAFIVAAVILFTLKSPIRNEPIAESSETPVIESDEGVGWGILDRRGFASLLSVVFLDSMVQAGLLTFIAFVLIAKGIALHIAPFAVVCVLVGGMFGKAVCGYLAERIGVQFAFSLVQLLTAAGIVAVVMAPSMLAFLLLPVLGAVLQGSTSITYSIVNDLVHLSRTSRGYALVYASSSFSSVAGPIGFGLIADRFGIDTAMVAMAIVTLTAIPACWLMRDGTFKSGEPV